MLSEHQKWWDHNNREHHFAHRARQDGRHSPVDVLRGVLGHIYPDEVFSRVLYATQGAVDPPTFTLFATRALPPQYLRYLERKLREAFDLGPTPLKLRVRRRND